jgi:hypothetical protein
MQWFIENAGVIFGVLFGISEVLGQIDSIKQNNVYGVVKSILSSLKDLFTKKA